MRETVRVALIRKHSSSAAVGSKMREGSRVGPKPGETSEKLPVSGPL